MRHLKFAAGFAALALSACGSVPSIGLGGNDAPNEETLRLTTSDLTGLGGNNYEGALTYLDYQSEETVMLDVLANVTVKLDCLNVAIQYPGEPEANSVQSYCISEDGTEFDGAPIISLQRLGPDFIAFQTETTGTDDDKPALLRQSYILSQTAITSGREVSYDAGQTWIERNELDIERAK